MFTGATVLITVVSALGLGILAGWAALAAVLHIFFATKSANEAKLAPQRAVTQVSVAASRTA
jgi:hypothetical protein